MSSIASQTWDVINETNAALKQGEKTLSQGEARVAQQNSYVQSSRLANLQQLERDVIIPADPNNRQVSSTESQSKVVLNKPTLVYPEEAWNAFQAAGDDQEGLIAIIGRVLCLQAKSNSNFWSTLWKQASESMMMEVKFAPIIGQAINNQYTAQANATQAQANQSKEDGIINLCMFGGAVLMGGFMEFTDEENPLNKPSDDIENQDETQTEENDEARSNAASADDNISEQTDNEINETNEDMQKQQQANRETNKEEDSFWDRGKKAWKSWKKDFARGQKRFTGLLGRGIQAAGMMQMLSQGITGWAVDSKYQGQQAIYQGQEGQNAALSKEAEQYAQFYGQDFSRSEDLRQGSGQNIDYAMNILKSAADTITQTVTSMFRG